MRARSLVGAIFAILIAPQASLAQTTAEAASSWGLLGTWQRNCGTAPSEDDPGLQYVVRGGKLFHDRDFGDRKDSSPVMSAAMKADGSIELVVNFTSLSQTRQYSFMKGSDGRVRAIFNRNVDTNEYTIRDGEIVDNGNDSSWHTRCR